MVNLKKASVVPQTAGNGIDKAQVRTDLPISYLQAGDSSLPVLIEDLRDMAPKVIVAEGMLKALVANVREISLPELKRSIQAKVNRADTMQELIEIMATEVQFHTSIELVRAYFNKQKEDKA
jgi:hypothetical protein